MQHASVLPAPIFRCRSRNDVADLALASIIAFSPGVAFAAWVGDDYATVDFIRVPEPARRRGLASTIYRLWESALPDGMLVDIAPVDAAAEAFWRTHGFAGHAGGRMRKTIVRSAGDGPTGGYVAGR